MVPKATSAPTSALHALRCPRHDPAGPCGPGRLLPAYTRRCPGARCRPYSGVGGRMRRPAGCTVGNQGLEAGRARSGHLARATRHLSVDRPHALRTHGLERVRGCARTRGPFTGRSRARGGSIKHPTSPDARSTPGPDECNSPIRCLRRYPPRWARGWSLGLCVRSNGHPVDRCSRHDAERPSEPSLTASHASNTAHGEGPPGRRPAAVMGRTDGGLPSPPSFLYGKKVVLSS